MEKNFIEEKIRDLLKDRIVVERIEFDNAIYIYSKSNAQEKWSGPPLYINKETGEHKFLFVADLVNGHDELSDYLKKKHS